MIVKVKSVPVRYNGKTHKPEEEFEMNKEHFNDKIVDLVEDDKDENPFSKLTKDEIKAELDAREITYEASANKDVLFQALVEATQE
jgi:hypothetical protein